MDRFEEILQRMEEAYEQESGCSVEAVSEVGLRIRVLAGELHRLDASLDWLERQAFPQTAEGEQLDLHGAQRGVTRRDAVKATGVVSFSRYLPLSFDLVVPKGTICATSGEPVVEYETTQEAVLKAGKLTIDIPVEAVVAGASGNAAAGYVTTLVNAPTGINYAANKEAITGGKDPEEDEEFRQRVLDAYSLSSSGANADYYRQVAESQEGITQVQVVPRVSGAGSVLLYLWGDGAAPSQEVMDAVKAELDRQREIGVTVTVMAAQKTAISVPVKIKVADEVDLEWAKEETKKAVEAYFESLGIGDGYYLGEISKAILNAVPVLEVDFPSNFVSIDGVLGYLIRPGQVTVEEIA